MLQLSGHMPGAAISPDVTGGSAGCGQAGRMATKKTLNCMPTSLWVGLGVTLCGVLRVACDAHRPLFSCRQTTTSTTTTRKVVAASLVARCGQVICRYRLTYAACILHKAHMHTASPADTSLLLLLLLLLLPLRLLPSCLDSLKKSPAQGRAQLQ
jgi:hypothetical protein